MSTATRCEVNARDARVLQRASPTTTLESAGQPNPHLQTVMWPSCWGMPGSSVLAAHAGATSFFEEKSYQQGERTESA